jgi:hypothetical protein
MDECSAIRHEQTSWSQELSTAGLNALVGGATAAALRVVHGQPDEAWRAFWKGAAGGGLVFAGKRLAVEGFDGAGFLGREVASVGGSVIRNASAGRGAFDELVLPVGPVRLYVGDGRVNARLDLATVIAGGAFMAAYDARLDFRASLSSGSLVFRGDAPMPGLTSAGATLLWRRIPGSEGPRLMAHERVHIIQYDQVFLSWGEELERWAIGRTVGPGPGTELLRHVDLGASVFGIRTGLAMALGYHARPWEREAYFLSQRVYPAGDGAVPAVSP